MIEMAAVLDLRASTRSEVTAGDKIHLQRFGRIDALVVDAEALCTHVGGGIGRVEETSHQNLLGSVSSRIDHVEIMIARGGVLA